MLINLLESTTTPSTDGNQGGGWVWLIVLVFLVVIMVFNHFSNKKRREQAEAEKEKRNAIRPGFTVTTIGGIMGTVVSVDDEANTFVLETGSDDNVSHIKFDKVAIYASTDPNAPVENAEQTAEVEETSADEESSDETVTETNETVEETNETVEETDVEKEDAE